METGGWGWTTLADQNKFKIAWDYGNPKVAGVGLDCGALNMKSKRIESISCKTQMPFLCFKTDVVYQKEKRISTYIPDAFDR